MTISSAEGARQDSRASSRLYRAVWRWHFYAGLVVVPFFILLASTGMIMLYGNSVETMLGPRHLVGNAAAPVPIVEQAAAAAAALPGGNLTMYVEAPAPNLANKFMVAAEDGTHIVAVDPNDATVVADYRQDSVLFNWASKIHGTLLLGDFGDRVLEIAAGLGIVLLLTGLYMWWPRGARSWGKALLPRLTKSRALWRDLHMSTGFYFAIVLLFFLFTGLAWTGIWGTQIVQAWNTFPAEKLGAPVSDVTHASLNHGDEHDVPWTLEQTPMPVSAAHDHSAMGMDHSGMNMDMAAAGPVTLDTVAATAREIGFEGQFRVNLPADETGVFTISTDSNSGDSSNPFGDRTVHIDQYSGEVISEVAFADYGLGGKAMAAGIALHQGNLGWWNIALNLLFCSAIILMAVSGVVMWWKRRPKGKVAAPLYPKQYRAPLGVIIIALSVCVAFPLTGAAIVVFALIDLLLPRRLKETGAG
ncbi:PepSY-associated TM helix domain-containing protein [Devosia rhizoryzae]|uniref:PepSY domain-containing protein n=1 Tax=Devosia rhizoryzae TaxID=2774137 RepID=A0ABX7C5K0_9HYPH|nr:PepSY domain-containing protein [Devosia rhizoryzae]QQR38499.1 PepSY domain-containing protein [Devosia rhizoryzae]